MASVRLVRNQTSLCSSRYHHMIARSICLYGVTGSGKSGQAGRFARYIYEKTGKITRYVASDGGDWYSVLKDLIDAGIIEYFDLRPLRVRKPPQSVYAALHRLGRGEWPQLSEGSLKMRPTLDWSNIGAYINDSGTGFAELIQEELEGSPNLVSGKEQTFSFELDGEKVSGGSWDHIRATQKTIKKLIAFFSALPVDRVLWTFGESAGEDKITKKTEYGLAVVGKAATSYLTKDFGVLLHCEKYAQQSSGEVDKATGKPNPAATLWRMYFQDHAEPQTGMLYLAKPRCQPTMYPSLLKKWPNGYLEPKITSGEMLDGLDDFMRFDDELDSRSNKGTASWKAGLDAARVGSVTKGGEK